MAIITTKKEKPLEWIHINNETVKTTQEEDYRDQEKAYR